MTPPSSVRVHIAIIYYALRNELLRQLLDYQFLHINWRFRSLYEIGDNDTCVPVMIWLYFPGAAPAARKKTTMSRG